MVSLKFLIVSLMFLLVFLIFYGANGVLDYVLDEPDGILGVSDGVFYNLYVLRWCVYVSI